MDSPTKDTIDRGKRGSNSYFQDLKQSFVKIPKKVQLLYSRYTGLGVCSGTIKRGCLEAVIAVMTKSFKS